jgi:hypothetical protein
MFLLTFDSAELTSDTERELDLVQPFPADSNRKFGGLYEWRNEKWPGNIQRQRQTKLRK